MTNPLVTVLISTYNRPTELTEAIKSIYAQTYQNFEIRLTRDGGMPVTVNGDERLHFIDRDENKGLSYSFNQSLRNARGKYICYLGDDDLFYPDHIETLVNALESNPGYGVAYTDLYKVHFKRGADGERVVMSKNVEINRDYDRMSLYRFNNMLHVSVMHRRDLLNKTGMYNEELTSLLDWDLNRRMSFYTDFLHIHKMTGEYYALINGDERISTRQRKNPVTFTRNFLKIRHTRPPKPWGKVVDLSILIPMVEFDKVINKTLRDIHLFIWYPHEVYIGCHVKDIKRIKSSHPHVNVKPCDGYNHDDIVAILNGNSPDGIKLVIEPRNTIGDSDIPWVEAAVNKELKGM